jgi:tetratricopeptide (TPR) repeat protein
MLDLPIAQVRGYVRAGFLAPARGPRGELRFSFQDLVLLRTAKGLLAARLPARRVRSALKKLRAQLPPDRPLTGVHISADGDRIVVRDGAAAWQPESGQVLLDFGVVELAQDVAPLLRRAAAKPPARELDADDWYAWGCDLEAAAPAEAKVAYERALALAPEHAGALINLGRLVHQEGRIDAAEQLYHRACAADPKDATAFFNRGVALEDLARANEAADVYRQALALDPNLADAHYNLACILERLGQEAAALRHLSAYRRLVRR